MLKLDVYLYNAIINVSAKLDSPGLMSRIRLVHNERNTRKAPEIETASLNSLNTVLRTLCVAPSIVMCGCSEVNPMYSLVPSASAIKALCIKAVTDKFPKSISTQKLRG